MANKAIRLGLIGAGGYGRTHVDGFREFPDLARIVAVADPSASVLRDLQPLLGPDVRYFQEYGDLLDLDEIDAVVICTPIAFHREMTLAALARGVFVLLEKPPVPLLSQLEELVAADSNRRVMVSFQKPYSDLIARTERILAGGELGRLQSMSAFGLWPRPDAYYRRANWAGRMSWLNRPTLDGPCTNGMAHFIHLAFHLAEVASGRSVEISEVSGALYRARPDLESYDTGFLSGGLSDGVRFFMGFSHAGSELHTVEMRLRGARGEITLSDDCRRLWGVAGEFASEVDDCQLLRRAFLEFAGGDGRRNRTPLSSMRPYVLATNLMVQSSGGIETIDRSHVRAVPMNEYGMIFAVDGLAGLLERCATKMSLPAHDDVPWARPSRAVRTEAFSERQMGCWAGSFPERSPV